MERKWLRSRKKTFIEENKIPKPTIKIKLNNITIGKNPKYVIILKLKIKNRGNKNINPIRKFKKLLKTEEMGMNSRGNIFCRNNCLLAKKEFVASVKALQKKSHGIIPARTKRE